MLRHILKKENGAQMREMRMRWAHFWHSVLYFRDFATSTPSWHYASRCRMCGHGHSMLRESRVCPLLNCCLWRWHPDKFVQNFGQRLHVSEREQIMRRVNEIAGMINSMAAK